MAEQLERLRQIESRVEEEVADGCKKMAERDSAVAGLALQLVQDMEWALSVRVSLPLQRSSAEIALQYAKRICRIMNGEEENELQ